MKRTLLIILFLAVMLGMFTSICAQTVTIGTGTSTTSSFPIISSYGYTYSQQIYTQAQIATSGQIQKIRFYYASGTTSNSSAWVIYMGHTTKTTFTSTTDWVPLASLTQVFNDNVTFPSVAGWWEITLSTPFNYNNSDNLVIAVDENTAGYGGLLYWRSFTSGTNTGIMYRSDGTNPDPASPPTAYSRYGSINQIQLVFPSTTPPLPANTPSPVDLATNVSVLPTLTWQSGGGEPTGYDVYFGTTLPPEGSPTVGHETQTTTSYNPGTLQRSTPYYWKIVPWNANGSAGYSSCPTWSFTTLPEGMAVIGDGTSTANNLPINPYYGYNYSQTLYMQSEISIPDKRIEKLWYYWNGLAAGTNSAAWTVYMGHTNKTAFSSTTDWVPSSGLSQVFSGSVSLPASAGWVEIVLTSPLSYNNVDNLVIAVNEYTPGDDGNSAKFLGTSTATNRGIRVQRDSGGAYDPANPGTGTLVAGIANVRLLLGTPPAEAAFNCSPTTWNFGQVELAVPPVTKQFTISNSGGAPLVLSSIDVTEGSDVFSITVGPDMTVNPGGSTNFTVQFDPLAAVPYSGNIRIIDNTTAKATHDVALSGEGFDPTVTLFPYPQGFEDAWMGTPSAPQGWTQLTVTGTNVWNRYSSSPHSGLYCAQAPWAGTGGEHLLITPPLSLGTNDYRLKFWLKGSGNAGTDLYVQIGSNNASEADFTTDLATYVAGTNMPTTWTEYTIDLSAYSGIQYIAFRMIDDDGYSLYLDDVLIELIPQNPLFSINPTTWNFGQVDLAVPPVTKQFTISNSGGAPLVLSSIDVTEGGDVFTITVGPDMTVNPGGSTNFTVQFDPQAVTSYTGNVQIIDNTGSKATHDVALSGEGYTRPAGSTCENPYDVVLPLDDFTGDTSLYGDDYSDAWVTPSSYYLGGDDMVLRFSLAVHSSLSGFLTAITGNYIGMLITQAIPNPTTPAPVLVSATSSGTTAAFSNHELPAGTYFLILSTWPAPQSFQFSLDLTATPVVTNPVFNINPTAWDYGQVMPGNSVAKVFTITNTGNEILFIDKDDVTITGTNADQFSLEALAADISLVRNASAQITVNFSPDSEGPMTANLQIIDNVADTKSFRSSGAKSTHLIQLDGEGYDSTISSFPFEESFDGSTFQPMGWINQQITGPDEGLWERTLVGIYPNCLPNSGEGMAKFNCWDYNAGTTGMLVTPPLNFGEEDYQVSFWMYRYSTDWSSYEDYVNVYAGAITNIGAATLLGSVYVDPELAPVEDANGWYKYTFPIPEVLMKGVGYVFFEGVSDYGYNIFIDDVSIEEASQGIIPIDPGNPGMPPNGVVFTPGGPVPPALLGEDSGLPALIYTISATGVWDVLVLKPIDWNTDWYCWLMAGSQLLAGPNPIPATTPDYTFYGVNFDAKGDVTVVVNDNQTLPVELSSFTAVLTADMFVRIAWMTESETNHLGYNILRGVNDSVAMAQRLNSTIIDQGTGLGSQVSYDFTDAEVDAGSTYYYWLESVDLGGLSTLFGPLTITVSGQPNDPGAPEIPSVTQLQTAFPNPFNPSTTLRYSLKQAGKVRLEIYNLKGQLIRRFERDHQHPGYYQQVWDGKDAQGNNVTSGVYIYRMVSGKYSYSRKMVLSK